MADIVPDNREIFKYNLRGDRRFLKRPRPPVSTVSALVFGGRKSGHYRGGLDRVG